MAKRKKNGDSELNLDSLMDAVTNVVGVLMIVFVVMAINTARVMQKILSDLPPVTKEEHEQLKKEYEQLPPPPADPKKLEDDKKKAEQDLKKAIEQLQTVDTSEMQTQMKFMDLESFRKKLEEAKKLRETQRKEVEKLLAEVERLKALLDQTPVYQPPPPTYVRLPNPRPFPEKPNITRVLVAKQGVLFLNDSEFIKPILDGLQKIRPQLEYKEVKIDPFAKMLQGILGTPEAVRTAWPELAPLVNTFQLDQVTLAYKALSAAQLPATRQVLGALGDISLVTRTTLPVLAETIVAATKGDLTKWTALDPSTDPTKPIITAVSAGGKIIFGWGATKVEAKATPKDILAYFVKDLAGMKAIKDRSRDRVVFDAFKLASTLERAASSPMMSTSSYTFKPEVKPGITYVQLTLTPKAGGGETVGQFQSETSAYQRLMRQIKGDANGVAIFQVMPDAFETYLEARKIADQIGVAATWEFLSKIDLTMNVTGYEVQRFAVAATARPAAAGTAVRITAPKRTLD